MNANHIAWEDYEYRHREHTKDWYWAVGIIAVAAAVTSLILKNYLFALFILIAALAMAVIGGRKPRLVHFEINDKGFIADRLFYPYSSLEAFWVEKHEVRNELILRLNRAFMPQIIVPLDTVNPDDVRALLLLRVHETMLHEQPLHRLMDYLGF